MSPEGFGPKNVTWPGDGSVLGLSTDASTAPYNKNGTGNFTAGVELVRLKLPASRKWKNTSWRIRSTVALKLPLKADAQPAPENAPVKPFGSDSKAKPSPAPTPPASATP